MKLTKTSYGGLLVGIAVTCLGCSESTTPKDVAQAERRVREEQQDVREAQQEGQREVAAAQRDAQHTVQRPVIEDANRDVAEARRDANQNVAAEQRDVREAQAELTQAQRELQATQARDQFARESQAKLEDADRRIDQLEERAKTLQGAEKDRLDERIKALRVRYDAADDAVGEMKRAELANWATHRTAVQAAFQDLMRDLDAVR